MVTIRKTLSVEEELIGLLFIEFGSLFFSQTMMSDMEGGIFCLLNPVSPFSPLQTMSRPIPGIL